MIASILALLKAIAEILGIAKYIYNETKETPVEKEAKIDASVDAEKKQAKETGRPKWD